MKHPSNAIVFCVDRRMILPALVAAEEAARSVPADVADVLVLGPPSAIDPSLPSWLAGRGSRVRIEPTDFDAWFPTALPSRGRFPSLVNARLLLPQHFSGRYRRLLSLDADLQIAAGLDRLFALDLGNRVVAAADDIPLSPLSPDGRLLDPAGPRHRAQAGLGEKERYANAGVLLIDVEAWNRTSLSERATAFLERHVERCDLPDQAALNHLIRGEFAPLSPIWNSFHDLYIDLRLRDLFSPLIVHFTGDVKPWMLSFWRLGAAETDRYRRFFEKSVWTALIEEPGHSVMEAAPPGLLKRLERLLSRAIGGKRFRSITSERRRRAERALVEQFIRTAAFADVGQGLARLSPASGRHAGPG